MGAWHYVALGRVLGVECCAQALRISHRILGAACGPHVRLALRLSRASCTQAGVAHWAGAAMCDGVG